MKFSKPYFWQFSKSFAATLRRKIFDTYYGSADNAKYKILKVSYYHSRFTYAMILFLEYFVEIDRLIFQ